MPKPEEVRTVQVIIKRETDKAFQVDCDECEGYVWIPKSCILEPEAETLGVGEEAAITIPLWLAREKGIE